MMPNIRFGTTVVAIAVLATVAGCARAPFESTAAADPSPAMSRPLTDFAEESYYSFKTLGDQLECRIVSASLACQTRGRAYTVADSALCGFYPLDVEQGNANRFGFFRGGPEPCATIVQGVGFHSPHTLASGQAVTAELMPGRLVTCTAADDALTCRSAEEGSGARSFVLTLDTFTVA